MRALHLIVTPRDHDPAPVRETRITPVVLLVLLFPLVLPGTWGADYASAIREFEAFARAEVAAGSLTGFSVVWIEDQQRIYSAGFGTADRASGRPAGPETVYRVGSISKLFTAVAAMQLAESGRLDIDAPAQRYVPEFRFVNPFEEDAVPTLRQLMCHRSGLIREAPVGGYFDGNEPSAAETVGSLRDCVLVHPPNTRTKYSNSGVTVVGRAVEQTAGIDFAAYQEQRVLGPMGMRDSAFRLRADLKPRLARGYLPVALPEGGFELQVAPQFEFGILGAGNLYSTVEDLGRFLSCLWARGRTASGALLREETLEEMWRVQLTGESDGFGLGFGLGRYRGHRTVGHSGEVYGFTSRLIGLPEERLGVVILANDDVASGPVQRLAFRSLDLVLRARLGKEIPDTEPESGAGPTPARTAVELAACEGDYESESYWARIEADGRGGLRAVISRQEFELRPDGADVLGFTATGRRADRAPVRFKRGASERMVGFSAFGQEFRRVDPTTISEVPESWRSMVGSYGPAFIPLILSIRHGHLYAMTENLYDYRLRPLNRRVFAMPPGLYESEHLIIETDRRGRVRGVILANMPLARRR